MNTEYHLVKVREKARDLNGVIDVATLGKNFYTSPTVENSLVKIEKHLDEAQEEAKKIMKVSY